MGVIDISPLRLVPFFISFPKPRFFTLFLIIHQHESRSHHIYIQEEEKKISHSLTTLSKAGESGRHVKPKRLFCVLMTAPEERRRRPGRRPPQQRWAMSSVCLINQKDGRDGETDGKKKMALLTPHQANNERWGGRDGRQRWSRGERKGNTEVRAKDGSEALNEGLHKSTWSWSISYSELNKEMPPDRSIISIWLVSNKSQLMKQRAAVLLQIMKKYAAPVGGGGVLMGKHHCICEPLNQL